MLPAIRSVSGPQQSLNEKLDIAARCLGTLPVIGTVGELL
jgi:hypothetical protein